MNLELEKFDPTIAELTAMVEATKSITATDLTDKSQMEAVKQNRIVLKNARVKITKIGKELREDAVKFQRAVIQKEKDLIAIIEPEETRLEAIEEEAKQLIIQQARLLLLPERKARLLAIDGKNTWLEDKEILKLDNLEFEASYNGFVAEYNEHKRVVEEARIAKERAEIEAKLEAQRKAFEEEKAKEEAERKAMQEAENKKRAEEDAIRQAEQDRINEDKRKLEVEKLAIQHAKELAEATEKARIEAEAKIKADQKLKAKQEAEEKAKLEKRKAFIAFREKHGYTEETKDDFITKETGEGYVLYKKVGVFNK